MQFVKALRDRIRRGEITTTVRLWQHPHVRVGGRYALPPGAIEVTRLFEVSLADVTPDLARRSGFAGTVELLKVAKHGPGRRVFVIDFRYVEPRMPDSPAKALARVRKIAMTLPDVEEGTTFGYPAFKTDGKTFAWFPSKKEVEPGSLGVRMSILEREHRIAARPDVFYVTPHYKDYASVLARIGRLNAAELLELLESGHEFMTVQGRPARRKRR